MTRQRHAMRAGVIGQSLYTGDQIAGFGLFRVDLFKDFSVLLGIDPRKIRAIGGGVLELALPRSMVHEGQEACDALVDQPRHPRLGSGIGQLISDMHAVIDRAVKSIQRAGEAFRETHVAHSQFAFGKTDAVKGGGHACRRHAPVDGIQRHGQREKGVWAGFDLFFDGVAVQVDQPRKQQVAIQVNPCGTLGRLGPKRCDATILNRQTAVLHPVSRHDARVFQMQAHAATSNALRSTVIFTSANRSTSAVS